jgi:hypothetical protein
MRARTRGAALAGVISGVALSTVVATAAANPLPMGLTCGMSYVMNKYCANSNNVNWINGYVLDSNGWPYYTAIAGVGACQPAAWTSQAPGFVTISDGDRGLPSGGGFYHQAYATSDPNLPASDRYVLPKGTACGFRESCNRPAPLCLGFDANRSCPPGWNRKWAADMNAPSGCNFVWCEYQDPHGLCDAGCSQSSNVPWGTVCGITDSRYSDPAGNGGQCMGIPTRNGCPQGYYFHGFFDDGSSGGNGVGLCMRGE